MRNVKLACCFLIDRRSAWSRIGGGRRVRVGVVHINVKGRRLIEMAATCPPYQSVSVAPEVVAVRKLFSKAILHPIGLIESKVG